MTDTPETPMPILQVSPTAQRHAETNATLIGTVVGGGVGALFGYIFGQSSGGFVKAKVAIGAVLGAVSGYALSGATWQQPGEATVAGSHAARVQSARDESEQGPTIPQK